MNNSRVLWAILGIVVLQCALSLGLLLRPMNTISVEALIKAQAEVTRTKDITNAILDVQLRQAREEIARLRDARPVAPKP